MSKRDLHTQRWLALGGILGPLLFFLLFTLAGWLRPGYSPIRQTVSALALGPNGWLQTANFVLFGALTLALAIGLWREVGRDAPAMPLSIALLGIAVGLFALFPSNRVPLNRTMHTALLWFVFAGLPLACALSAWQLRRLPHWRALVSYTLLTGLLDLALVIVASAWAREIRPWLGLYERIMILVPFLWLEVVALRLYRRSSRGEPSGVVEATGP